MTSRHISWEESSNGNPIAKDDYNEVICTVFQNDYGAWGVVINVGDPYIGLRPHYSDKHFVTMEQAQKHAETLIANRHTLEPTQTAGKGGGSMAWRVQAKKCNGAPTYGRQYGSKRASVKQAKSGKWYYVISVGASPSPSVGWFSTHQEAMAACDFENLPR